MDAGHRHKLKTNELAQQLGQLPKLAKENANFIIGTALIVIGLITWPVFSRMRLQKDMAAQSSITQSIQMLDKDVYDILQAQDGDAQNQALGTLLVNADTLLEKAEKIDNPNLAALARIKAAQAIRTELHLRKDVSPEMLENQIQKAKSAYEQALESAKTPTLKAMAKLGLGLCAEELGQTAQAGDIYKEIVSDKTFEATVFPKQAQQRLDSLEDNAQTFTFAPAPAEAPAPAAPVQTSQTEPLAVIEAAPEPAVPATPEQTSSQP